MSTKTNNNFIDAAEADYLYKTTSQLPQSGEGLYTAIAIYKDEIIAQFEGELLSPFQAHKRAQAGNDRYFINCLNGQILDSMHKPCFAKYANDAQGIKPSPWKNNAKIALDEKGKICLQATRNIQANEEVFCSYGKRYWEKHHPETTLLLTPILPEN